MKSTFLGFKCDNKWRHEIQHGRQPMLPVKFASSVSKNVLVMSKKVLWGSQCKHSDASRKGSENPKILLGVVEPWGYNLV